MDLYTSLAINALLHALKDPLKRKRMQAAAFKVFREIGYTYEKDAEFVKWAKEYAAAREQS
jgi:hypothetical protein